MFCRNCGRELDDSATVCMNCGASAKNTGNMYVSNDNIKNNMNSFQGDDQGNMLGGVASCCFPIVGLVLYLVWKDSKPKSAKHACYGALIGIVAGTLLSILYFFLIFSAVLSY